MTCRYGLSTTPLLIKSKQKPSPDLSEGFSTEAKGLFLEITLGLICCFGFHPYVKRKTREYKNHAHKHGIFTRTSRDNDRKEKGDQSGDQRSDVLSF